MGLFDIFTFKKQAQEVFSKENVKEVLDRTRSAIIDQIKAKYPGAEKMVAVQIAITTLISSKVSGCTNKLVLWLVNLIIKAVPAITQTVYDFLKEKVENL